MEENTEKKITERSGVVIEALPNTMFRVELNSLEGAGEGSESEVILAYLAGKMRQHRIRVLVGDKVTMEMDPYGGKARITRRL